MEQDQEEKPYVCKVCSKQFTSPRVLGGHMRSHLASNPNKDHSKMVVQSGYGVTECPEKSQNVSIVNVCKACGKEFDSPRSLFGHLRHHSTKKKKVIPCKECGKWFRSMRSLINHMRVHPIRVCEESRVCSSLSFAVESLNEAQTLNLVRRKRSKRVRYKASASSSSFSSFYESSSVTVIEQEVEEVAMCLMMLSEGVHDLGGFNFGHDSSDDNSANFDVKSPNHNKKRVRNEVDFRSGGGDQFLKRRRHGDVLDSLILDSSTSLIEQKMDETSECDSGFLDNTQKKIEVKLRGYELQSDGGFTTSNLYKNSGLDASGTALVPSGSDSEPREDSRNKTEYRCKTCEKVFNSYQALGGHQTVHRMSRNIVGSKNENSENMQPGIVSETATTDSETEKIEAVENLMVKELGGLIIIGSELRNNSLKEHKCSICLKIFATGQALGGHKKIHHTKGSKIICNVLDLNLPAIVDEESTADLNC